MRSHVRRRRLHVFLDREGSLLIEHLSRGHPQALELEKELSLPPLEPLGIMWSAVRTDHLDEPARNRVRAAAADHHWELTELDKLEPPPEKRAPEPAAETPDTTRSTVEALHSHTLAPSAREKVIVPFVVLGIIAVVSVIGYVVWDHANHDYGRVRSVSDLLRLSQNPPGAQGALAGLVNPDDSRYVALDVTGWQAWVGAGAITEDTFVRLRDLDLTMEELIKGDRGSARIVFRFDLTRSEDGVLVAESIVRAGIKLPYRDTAIEFLPLPVVEAPTVTSRGGDGTYAADGEIRHDQEKTFKSLTRFACTGFIEEGDTGLRMVNRQYRVALSAVDDPAVRVLIDEIKLTPQESRELDAYIRGEGKFTVTPAKRVQAFLALEDTYDWGTSSAPGRRQETREIGGARLDGLQVARVYVTD